MKGRCEGGSRKEQENYFRVKRLMVRCYENNSFL